MTTISYRTMCMKSLNQNFITTDKFWYGHSRHSFFKNSGNWLIKLLQQKKCFQNAKNASSKVIVIYWSVFTLCGQDCKNISCIWCVLQRPLQNNLHLSSLFNREKLLWRRFGEVSKYQCGIFIPLQWADKRVHATTTSYIFAWNKRLLFWKERCLIW